MMMAAARVTLPRRQLQDVMRAPRLTQWHMMPPWRADSRAHAARRHTSVGHPLQRERFHGGCWRAAARLQPRGGIAAHALCRHSARGFAASDASGVRCCQRLPAVLPSATGSRGTRQPPEAARRRCRQASQLRSSCRRASRAMTSATKAALAVPCTCCSSFSCRRSLAMICTQGSHVLASLAQHLAARLRSCTGRQTAKSFCSRQICIM